MIIHLKRASGSSRLQVLLCCFLSIAASIAGVGAIGSSRDPGRNEWDSAEDDARRMDILAVADPTPTPVQCPPCTFRTGTENFDGVTPPALPQDWTVTNAQGPPPLWITSNSGVPMPSADTPPNAAFIDDPAVVSDKRLDSPRFVFFEVFGARLTFRQNFNLEASDVDPNIGFDGGVLELSTDGGNTFQDIVAAGGSFLIGGYNRIISTDRGSPIAGRQAWSGNSEGFITSVVNLPLFQTDGRLRWRMASDTSGSSEGWRVDMVNLTYCRAPPCSPTPSAPRFTPIPRPRPTPPPRP